MIGVFIGGFLGTISRVSLSTLINRYWPYIFPIATFTINCIGSFFIGIAAGLYLNEVYESFFIIGFLGGFTTFSTFSVENAQLLLHKKPLTTILYILATVVICLLLTFFGIYITDTIYGWRKIEDPQMNTNIIYFIDRYDCFFIYLTKPNKNNIIF